MTVFDWLEGIPLPDGSSPYDVVELRFKNNRKQYVRRPNAITVHVGDVAGRDGTHVCYFYEGDAAPDAPHWPCAPSCASHAAVARRYTTGKRSLRFFWRS